MAEFVDGIASETKTEFAAPNAVDEDEKLMKKLGIPTGFTTTKVSLLLLSLKASFCMLICHVEVSYLAFLLSIFCV